MVAGGCRRGRRTPVLNWPARKKERSTPLPALTNSIFITGNLFWSLLYTEHISTRVIVIPHLLLKLHNNPSRSPQSAFDSFHFRSPSFLNNHLQEHILQTVLNYRPCWLAAAVKQRNTEFSLSDAFIHVPLFYSNCQSCKRFAEV